MRKFLRHIMVFATLAMCFMACSQPEEPVVQEENVIESDYLQILEQITALMQADAPPEKTLDALRHYVDSNKDKTAQIVHALRKTILSMDEDARANWRKTSIPRLNRALEQFAHAQMHLQKKMNEVQKWELGEILSLLKQ